MALQTSLRPGSNPGLGPEPFLFLCEDTKTLARLCAPRRKAPCGKESASAEKKKKTKKEKERRKRLSGKERKPKKKKKEESA